MKIKYGTVDTNIDITDYCYNKLCINNIIKIPPNDYTRSRLFTDPIVGTVKSIFIFNNGSCIECKDDVEVNINTIDNTVQKINIEHPINTLINLIEIQDSLQLKYGKFKEELPEQEMVLKYLSGNEKVLEIGGNIGRNSLVICKILKDNNNLVTLESHTEYASQLRENRDINNMTFFVENSALSKRNLIQKNWYTMVSDVLLEDYIQVNSITFNELQTKYNIKFDTLVLDCEESFYHILMDMPELLTNINMIIMENDYWDISRKQYIDDVLGKNNFKVVYSESGGWGPCYNNFYEVWKKVL
jgi:FkbM family methyltransferase